MKKMILFIALTAFLPMLTIAQNYWTSERILMATPMPSIPEQRNFISSHPPLETIRTWSLNQFKTYIQSPLGLQYVAEEAIRWRDIAVLLQKRKIALLHVLSLSESTSQSPATQLDSTSLETVKQMLAGTDVSLVFEKMKILRQQIADNATQVDALRKEAEQKGLGAQAAEAIDKASQ